jgi:xanthine dehydrogenase accessory factor
MTRVPDDGRQVLAELARWHAEGEAVALVTVVDTWGSSPRPVGSLLAVTADGRFAGSVSGGCVETAVLEEARGMLGSRERKRVEYGVTNDTAWDVGLPCGGRIQLLIEPLIAEEPVPDALFAVLAHDHPAVLVKDLASGATVMLRPNEESEAVSAAVREQAMALLHLDTSRLVEADGRELFFHVFASPMRLIIVGSVEIGQTLAQMAGLLGYDVCFVEPRRAFASRDAFRRYTVHPDWPDAAVRRLAPDARTAVIALTHDPKLDDPALIAALQSPAFYVGCLGSRRSHAVRRERLTIQGVPHADLDRIHGPVGLAIGARTPAEIAVSILADLVRVSRDG